MITDADSFFDLLVIYSKGLILLLALIFIVSSSIYFAKQKKEKRKKESGTQTDHVNTIDVEKDANKSYDVIEKTVRGVIGIVLKYIQTSIYLSTWMFGGKQLSQYKNQDFFSKPYTYLFITSCITYVALHFFVYILFYVQIIGQNISGLILERDLELGYIRSLVGIKFSFEEFIIRTSPVLLILGGGSYLVKYLSGKFNSNKDSIMARDMYIYSSCYTLLLISLLLIVFGYSIISIFYNISLPGNEITPVDTSFFSSNVFFIIFMVVIAYLSLNWVALIYDISRIFCDKPDFKVTVLSVILIGTTLYVSVNVALGFNVKSLTVKNEIVLSELKRKTVSYRILSVDKNKVSFDINLAFNNNTGNTIILRKTLHSVALLDENDIEQFYMGSLNIDDSGVIIKNNETILLNTRATMRIDNSGKTPEMVFPKKTSQIKIGFVGYYANNDKNLQIFEDKLRFDRRLKELFELKGSE